MKHLQHRLAAFLLSAFITQVMLVAIDSQARSQPQSLQIAAATQMARV